MTLYHEGQIVTIVRAETWMPLPIDFVGGVARVVDRGMKNSVTCEVLAGKYMGHTFYFDEGSLRPGKSCPMS